MVLMSGPLKRVLTHFWAEHGGRGGHAEVGTGDGGEDSVFLGSCGEVASSFPFPEDAGVGHYELQWGLKEEGRGSWWNNTGLDLVSSQEGG